MTQIDIINAVARGTEFLDSTFPEQLELHAGLGFLAVQGSEVGGGVTILGYSPLADGEHMPYITSSVTELSQVPEADQTIDKQGKGVGMRLYVSPHAIAGLARKTHRVAAFTVTVSVADMLDMRAPTDTTFPGISRRLARHAGRMAHSRTQGLAAVTDAIHATYGDAQTVRFNQPPRARLREIVRGARQPIPSGFLLVRDSDLPIYGAGVRRSLTPPSK